MIDPITHMVTRGPTGMAKDEAIRTWAFRLRRERGNTGVYATDARSTDPTACLPVIPSSSPQIQTTRRIRSAHVDPVDL